MPTPSSSFDSIASLPPRVVAIRNAIFQTPDDTGLSVSVPSTYALYTGSTAPDSDVGSNGDWYFYSSSGTLRTYRKVIGVWTLVSSITGGGGGGSGDIDGGSVANATITNSSISGGTISSTTMSGSTINTSTLASPVITTPTVTSGTFATPAITGGTITTASFVNPTITGGSMTGTAVTGLPAPFNPSDAATKDYVDGAAAGLQIKAAATVATVDTNVTLSGGAPDELDGVSLEVGDRILVKNQTDATQNGIYDVTTLGTGANGTWARTADADTGEELPTGSYVFILEGSEGANTAWVMNTSGAITIGVSELNWTLYSQIAVGEVDAENIIGQIVESQIANLSITTAKFAASIKPIEIVSSLPVTGNFHGRTVFLTADDGVFLANKLYRWTSSTETEFSAYWSAAVPAVDITGELTSDQIAGIEAAKLTTQITATQIENGSITTPKLAAGAVTTAALAAGSVTADTIAANAITTPKIQAGAITTSKLSAGVVTANELAANSVVAGKIQAGAISATELAIGAVSETRIANGAVVTDKLAANSVIASKILAGTITADKLSVASLSAITANIGTITSGTLTSSISITVGSGVGAVSISSSGLSIGAGRVSLTGDGTNPWVRVSGISTYSGHYVEMNGQGSFVPPYIGAMAGGVASVLITTTGGVTIGNSTSLTLQSGSNAQISSGATVTIASGATLRGPGGINLFGADSNALNIACGEDAGAGSLFGYLVLHVNGRAVKVPFYGLS